MTGAARPDANNPEDHLKAFFSIAAALLAGKIGPFAWSAVAIEGFLAVTFGYCFLAERRLVMANQGG